MSRLVAISEDTVTTLASEVRASRRVLAGLLRRHRALRARLDDSASRRPRATAGPVPLSTGKQERYWVQRGAHTRRGTFTALLTPWPGDEGGPGGPGGPAQQ